MSWFTLYFCCGIIFAHFVKAPFWLFYAFALVLFCASLLSIKKDFIFKITCACLVFSLGAALFANTRALPKAHISKFISYKNDTVFTVKGFVNSQPQLKDGRASFIFASQELEFNRERYKSCGDILVQLKETQDLCYGEGLILRGSLHKPFKLYSDDICAVMHVTMPGAVVRLAKNYGRNIQRLAFQFKSNIEAIIYKRLSRLAAGISSAMILGEEKDIPAAVYDAMAKSGTVHILVVSGFNVGIVAFIIILLLKALRVPRKLRYFLAIPCLVIYCFATGAQAPVARATIMAIFFLTGLILKREPEIGNSFSLAVLFILLADPRELFSISFQLSFASVAAIIFLYPKLKAFFKAESIKPKILRFIAEGSLVSFCAWLATCGFIAYYFRFFSPVTVLANIFIVPLATLITLCGFSLVMVSLIFPSCAGFFSSSDELLVALLLNVNNSFIHLPFAYLYL